MQLTKHVRTMQRISPGVVLAWMVLVLAGSFTAEAQGNRGEISGKIVDNTGAVLPGVTVVVTNQDTGVLRTLVSDEGGRYLVSNLPPGPYEFRAELQGFRSVVQRNLQVTVGSQLVVDFELGIGEFTEAVEVVSETPMVDITSSSVGGIVSREMIENLPLNARSFDQLTTLQAGVVLTKNQNRSFQGGNTTKMSIRGARTDQNKLLLDGTDVRGITGELPGSVAGTSLGVDSVREFQVSVGTYSAEHGGAAGGVINVVTKSGTNAFSGTAFEFHRNDSLDEKNYFDEGEQPPFTRNQFGFSIGGPIRRNRAFVFANVEAVRENLGMTLRPVVPTAAARQGVLPTRTVSVDPRVVPYLALYPLPNGREFGDGTAEFVHEAKATTTENYAVVRFDQSFSEKSSLFARYTIDQAKQSQPEFFEFTPIVASGRNQYLTVEHNYILSSQLVNTFSFGLNRTFQKQAMVADYPEAELEALAWVPGRQLLNQSSLLIVTGLDDLGDQSDPRTWIFTFPQWKNTLGWSKGAHQLKAGLTYALLDQNITNEVFNGGVYDFTSLERFLTNQATRFQLTDTAGFEPGRIWRSSYFGWFVQDQYHASNRVTVDVGFRHEIWTGPSEKLDRCANLINNTDLESTVGCPLWETQSRNFMPRVGLAWDVTGTGRTSLRTGFGIFYDSMTAGQWWTPGESQLPFSARRAQNNPPFPNGSETIGGTAIPVTSPAPLSVTAVPHTMQYSFSLQHLLAADLVIEIGYAGAQGRNNWVRGDQNQRVPTILADGTKYFDATTPRRLNSRFGEIRRHMTAASGDYNGLLVSAKKRFSQGFQFQGSYTWSKAMDVAGGTAQPKSIGAKTSVMDAYDIDRDRGLSDFHATHNFVVNGVWEVPVGTGLTGLAAALLEGWQIAGVFTMITGSPVNIALGFNRSQTGSTGSGMHERPNLAEGASQNPVLGNPDQWYDPLAFVLQPAGYFGNLGKNTVTGPNLRTLDLSFSKMTSLAKGTRLQLRFEVFNVLNRANFGQPANTVFSAAGRVGSAGRITDTNTPARQMQLGAKLLW